MDAEPLRILREVFGFAGFRPHQAEIVAAVLAGRDAFVLMPTGGGKSLCYQLPALLRPGTAVVVSPLIALMKDQVDGLCANGVRAACYNSSLTSGEARRVLARLHGGDLDLLYMAPERLMADAFLERLREIPLALFAIDEAHCISKWGHDFRPEYIQLGMLRGLFPEVPVIALTATADAQTRADILERLGLRQPHVCVAGFDRPNIRYTVVVKRTPFAQLCRVLQRHSGGSGIVYCLSRRRVEDVAGRLRDAGFTAAPYHAGLAAGDRRQTQEAFLRDDVQVVVATVAFGMGIDKPNVRCVVHYDLPHDVESYYQETGRAGRDGLPAEAVLLFSYADTFVVRSLIDKSEDAEQRRVNSHKLKAMVALADGLTCRRRVLLGYFGERLPADCGNCDVCMDPPQQYDATEDARKALSCVYRVGQRFGLHHVIEVLRGANTARIRQLEHDRLPTYGLGREKGADEWASLIHQLIHRGYLEQDIARFSVLKLTDLAKPLLRGQERLMLARPRYAEPAKTDRSRHQRPLPGVGFDEGLFQALRALRKRLADRDGIPPYIVFGDVTLKEMAARCPEDEFALLEITGVGKAKLARYGADFLEAIRSYRR